MDLTISSEKIGNPLLVELLRKLTDSFNKINKEFYVIGAAVCVALIGKDTVHYAWQGNVRLHKIDNGNYQLLTTDHIVNCGCTTLLTRCINGKGFREPIPVESVSTDRGNIIYLCSDGYYQSTNNMQSQLPANLSDDASMIEIIFE